MYRTALALTSATLMLTATTAAAQETEPPPGPPPINACGTTLTVEEVKVNLNEREKDDTGFALSGNFVLRISDEDSSVVVRLPGLATGELNGDVGTVTQTGRTLLAPDPRFPFRAVEIAEEGLPELSIIVGKLVIEETVSPTGPTSFEIVSIKGRVIDVCELLAR